MLHGSGMFARATMIVAARPVVPTKEEYIRDCPRLNSQLYQIYRTSTDPVRRIQVEIELSGPEIDLQRRFGLMETSGIAGVIEAFVHVSVLCDLANAPEVRRVVRLSRSHLDDGSGAQFQLLGVPQGDIVVATLWDAGLPASAPLVHCASAHGDQIPAAPLVESQGRRVVVGRCEPDPPTRPRQRDLRCGFKQRRPDAVA